MAASKTWPRGGQPLSSRPRCWSSAYRSVQRVREEVTLKAMFSIMQGVWGMQRSGTGFALSENVYEASPPQWGYRWGFIDISSPNCLGSEPLCVPSATTGLQALPLLWCHLWWSASHDSSPGTAVTSSSWQTTPYPILLQKDIWKYAHPAVKSTHKISLLRQQENLMRRQEFFVHALPQVWVWSPL